MIQMHLPVDLILRCRLKQANKDPLWRTDRYRLILSVSANICSRAYGVCYYVLWISSVAASSFGILTASNQSCTSTVQVSATRQRFARWIYCDYEIIFSFWLLDLESLSNVEGCRSSTDSNNIEGAFPSPSSRNKEMTQKAQRIIPAIRVISAYWQSDRDDTVQANLRMHHHLKSRLSSTHPPVASR